MGKKYLLVIAITTLVLSIIFIESKILNSNDFIETFASRNLSMGSRGNDVAELQNRLQLVGYYSGNIDGVFGYQTLYAVRKFQNDFGIKVDGVVGTKTREILQNNTKNQANKKTEVVTEQNNANEHFSSNDLKLLANAVYGESRGEPYIGQVAVASVVLNRLKSETFPNSISGVIFEPRAFTAVADGQIWMEPNDTAKKAVQDAINGWDPTGGAIYYFNPNTATSGWIWTRPQRKQIGKHIFCD
jgi:N-acetylmuramoyl-L-alanine amidase